MLISKETIGKKVPGIEGYLVGWRDLSEAERGYIDKKYTRGIAEKMYFVSCDLDGSGNWRFPFDVPMIRELMVRKGEMKIHEFRVDLGAVTVIGKEPTKGRLVHDSIGVAKIELVKNIRSGDYWLYLSDSQKIDRVNGEIAMEREQLDDLWHERKLAIIMDRTGDRGAIWGVENWIAGKMSENWGIKSAADELSMGGSVETAVRVLNGDVGRN